tara:strand:- start:115 stop:945 length:831 start_codon:yes stop_codon:yes gene_type:complete
MKTKHKHNKKRNTAFLFESLINEMTKSIMNGTSSHTSKIKKLLSENFGPQTILGKELDCYRSILETCDLDSYTAEKLLFHAKKEYEKISPKKIFEAQSKLIKKINENISTDVYNNFVPNYRSYATLAQIFNPQTPIKRRVLMENKILKSLTEKAKEQSPLQNVDSLVVTKYVERFNEEYSDLLTEQRLLLNNYIVSIGDNRADFIVFLNEELKRIRDAVKDSLSLKEVNEDPEMLSNTHKLLEKIDVVDLSDISDGLILKVLKLQSLVKEYQTDDN